MLRKFKCSLCINAAYVAMLLMQQCFNAAHNPGLILLTSLFQCQSHTVMPIFLPGALRCSSIFIIGSNVSIAAMFQCCTQSRTHCPCPSLFQSHSRTVTSNIPTWCVAMINKLVSCNAAHVAMLLTQQCFNAAHNPVLILLA